MSKLTLKNKFRGAILGTAIGDALGAPFEMMTRDQIVPQVPTQINDYMDGIIRPPRVHPNTKKPGQYTDDTQLTLSLARSIIRQRTLDPLDIAKELVNTYQNEELRGWGRSTVEAVKRLESGASWYRAAEGSMGIGNGIAMKAAPMGLYFSTTNQYIKDTSKFQYYLNSAICVGKITHNEIGITAGVLQSILITMAAQGCRNRKEMIKILTNAEIKLNGNDNFMKLVRQGLKKKLSIEQLADTYGTDPRADKSWVTVAIVYLKTRSRKEARNNLFELIKQGGDTDTLSAMYGALIGARWGTRVFPSHLIKKLENNKEIIKLADELYNVAAE